MACQDIIDVAAGRMMYLAGIKNVVEVERTNVYMMCNRALTSPP